MSLSLHLWLLLAPPHDIPQPNDEFAPIEIVAGVPGETPEPHAYIESTWLSCVKPWDHGSPPDVGVTADQMAARHIGRHARGHQVRAPQVG